MAKKLQLRVTQFLLICLLCSCASDKEYKKNGFSFIVPAGWKISSEHADKRVSDLMCEKSGLLSSGLISITSINDSLDQDSEIKEYVNSYRSSLIFLGTFSVEPLNGLFHTYSGKAVSFHTRPSIATQQGKIYCFYACNKTFTITIIQAQKDSLSNYAAIEKIVNSFSCY